MQTVSTVPLTTGAGPNSVTPSDLGRAIVCANQRVVSTTRKTGRERARCHRRSTSFPQRAARDDTRLQPAPGGVLSWSGLGGRGLEEIRGFSFQSSANTIDINDWSTGDSATMLLVSNALRRTRV
jgi:hypothetical protein